MREIKVKGSAALFQNRAMELLSRTHPAVILSMYLPLVTYLCYYFYARIAHSGATLAAVFFAGFFSWTFFEYILHRYIFHIGIEHPRIQRVAYLFHGVHHEYPRDKERLVMPPVPSIIVATVFFCLFRLIFGSYVFAFFPGFVTGYLTYGMIHYAMHAFRPPKNRLRFFWEYHNRHHFQDSERGFGVSSPLWDIVFGTYPKMGKKQKTEAEAGRLTTP
jgi:sterol desaturase/sphingolipid hydroxylase (fatty acid hydroxylase superfamily)